jgi:hypothetical protein
VLLPQRKESFGESVALDGLGGAATKERSQRESGRFGVFGERSHRTVAQFLAEVDPGGAAQLLQRPNERTQNLKDRARGVMLLYLVRDKRGPTFHGDPAIGFELLYPDNDLPYDTSVSVRKAGEGVVVASE